MLYESSPDGTEISVLPKPMSPNWKVLRSRFELSCWVTTTVWAGAVAVASLVKSIRYGSAELPWTNSWAP